MAAIALFGVVAYRALPISDLPQVDYPTINVQAGLPGGDPVTMASSVASPLERQFTTIAGVDSMVSQSGTGSSQITMQFDLDRDIYSATVDVQTAIAAAMPLLPATMTSPPSFRRQNPSADPDPAAQPDVADGADVGPRRLRRDDDRAADRDGERRVAGAGPGRVQVRRAGADRSRQAARAAASASTRSIRRCRTGTSTSRPGSCSARPRPTTSRRPAS